jgi:hypothetical protein
MKRVLLISLACLVAASSVALAGTSDDARFALHRKATTTKTAQICTSYSPNASGTPCDSYVTTGPTGNFYQLVYMVVGHGPQVGINGVSFGIDYGGRFTTPGVKMDPRFTSLILCADGLPFNNGIDWNNDGTVSQSEEFPAPKGGTRITWVTCDQDDIPGYGVHALIGALGVYVYSADQLSITPNNNLESGAELTVASCDGTETPLLQVFPQFAWYSLMGRVDFGGGTGLNPCLITATKETTWGKIKGLYNN